MITALKKKGLGYRTINHELQIDMVFGKIRQIGCRKVRLNFEELPSKTGTIPESFPP
jgi:hypothetical protein